MANEEIRVVDEEVWRAWVQKGRLRQQAAARKMKIVAGVVLGLLAAGTSVYVLAVK